jgi:hypothetical protein
VLITLLGAIFFGPFSQESYGEGWQAAVMAALNNVVNLWFVVFLEGILGFLYGVIRSGRSRPNRWKGVLIGLVVWACLALPLACIGILAAFFGGASPHGELSFMEVLGYIFGLYLAQIVCGAVAGLLVELQRERAEPREPV